MIRASILIILVVALSGANAFAAEPVEVFAGIPPVAYLVERIGGDRVHVEVFIQPGQDPHTFEPGPKQIQALGQARLFFKVGLPFENQVLEKIRTTHPRLTVVDTTRRHRKTAYFRGTLPLADARRQGESSQGDSPEDFDPHVWLSPPLLKTMAANIASTLEKSDPGGAAFFKANRARLDRDLDEVDAKIRGELRPYEGKSFFVFHPAFGYFAACYGLKQEAVEAGGKQPSPRQLRELVEQARAEHARVIFVEPQFDPHSAQVLADAIGGRVVTMNDMEKDVLANLQDIAGKIEKSFGESNDR